MNRLIGDVWRENWTSTKPWAVQGPGAVAHFRTKKQAVQVGELFLYTMAIKLEYERVLNERDNTPGVPTGATTSDGDEPSGV